MRILHLFLCAFLGLITVALAADPVRAIDPSATGALVESRASEAPFVTVVLHRISAREYRVPWVRGLTVGSAIAKASGTRAFVWKEAWRRRETFWTRNFRDPHSFWARILAGEKATGYDYFPQEQGNTRKAQLRPGDQIFVDLEPIA